MSSIPAVRTLLLADATVAGLVGTKVRADAAEQADAMPYIVLRRPRVVRDMGLDGTVLAKGEVFEIECWDDQRIVSTDLEDAVVSALIAGDILPDDNDPDAIDPDVDARCTVVTCTVWSGSFA